MNILFLTDNFPPEVNAPATRTYEHCKEWVKDGVQVTVITCNPNFPKGKVYEGYKNTLSTRTEFIEGIRVIRVWSYISKNKGFFKRVVDFISYAIMAFIVGLTIKTDVIIATSPQFFTAIAGRWLAFFKRKPWIFELRDLWPDSIRSVTSLKNQWVLNILERIELKLYKKANMVIAVTDAFKTNLISRGIRGGKIQVITNGCNLDLFDHNLNAESLKEELGLKGKRIVSYIGTHGLAHDLGLYVKELSTIDIPNLFFLFIGDGATKQYVLEKAKERKIKNALFLDPVSKDEIIKYWAISDIALVPLKKDETFLTVIPSKMFEAAAMKTPILLGVDGQARKILEEYEVGLFYEPGDFLAFRERLEILTKNQDMYKAFAENGLKMARDFDRRKLAMRMLELVKEVSCPKP